LLKEKNDKEAFVEFISLYEKLNFELNKFENSTGAKDEINGKNSMGLLFNSYFKKYKLIFNNLDSSQAIILKSDRRENSIATIELLDEKSEIPELKIFAKYDFKTLFGGFENKTIDEKFQLIEGLAKSNLEELYKKLKLNETCIELDFSDFNLDNIDSTHLESNENLVAYYKYFVLKHISEVFELDSKSENDEELRNNGFNAPKEQLEKITAKIGDFSNSLKKAKADQNNPGWFSWVPNWFSSWGGDSKTSQPAKNSPKL